MSNVTKVTAGRMIDYTPASAVTAGDVVVIGELVAVALSDIAANRLGALAVEGIFDFPKATTSGSGTTAGANWYWKDASDVASKSSGDGKLIGKHVGQSAVADSDTTVRIKLNQ